MQPVRLTEFIGKNVRNARGEDLGEISDVVVDVNNERVHYAILSFDQGLALGDKLFAYPMRTLELSPDGDEIVLNVSHAATRKLTIDNEWIQFTARFSGQSQEVAVPMTNVAGIFAKETGYGFAFTVAQEPVAASANSAAESQVAGGDDDRKPRAKSSHLQVIK